MTIEEILELIQNRQYSAIRSEFAEWNEADIAQVLEQLESTEQIVKVFRILPKSMAADVFAYLSLEVEQAIITSLTDREAANIINIDLKLIVYLVILNQILFSHIRAMNLYLLRLQAKLRRLQILHRPWRKRRLL